MARVICAKCQLDPEIVTNANGQAEARCPGCGQRDNVDDAVRIAGEQATDRAKSDLNDALRNATRGSKFIKLQREFPTGGHFRWKAVD